MKESIEAAAAAYDECFRASIFATEVRTDFLVGQSGVGEKVPCSLADQSVAGVADGVNEQYQRAAVPEKLCESGSLVVPSSPEVGHGSGLEGSLRLRRF
jgi:hypothetical protein